MLNWQKRNTHIESKGRKRNNEFSSFEDVVEVSDVADGQSQNLDFGQFFIRGQCRQQFPQVAEGDVERLDANAFARRVRRPVLLRGSPTTPTLLSRQRR